MKVKSLVMLTMFLILFPIGASNVSAGSSFVIGEEKAGGYQYTVIKEESTFIWRIGHGDNMSVIVENKENIEDLESFRTSVEAVNLGTFEVIISASYLLIVILTTLIFFRKNKQILKSSGAIIAVFAGIALYYTILNAIDLHTAFQDAQLFYSMLTN
ncbi:hypothetical protein AAEO50_02250 [Rossellomorea oryzaecorticis]|uniref:Uncharacterized protein n=1 Tax=Rossellomorea oryzaecorticis TaxID=1396505 RepID=A0ABU9K524_9BACI